MTKTPKKAAKKSTAKKPAKAKTDKTKSAGKAADRPGKALAGADLEKAVDALMNPVVVPGPTVDLCNGFKATTGDQIRALVKGFDTLTTEGKRNNEAKGTMLTKAVENKHLDKPAWRALLVLRKLNPRSLSLLMKYADDLHLWDNAAIQLEMFKEQEINPDDEVDAAGEKQQALPVDAAAEAATGLAPSRRPGPTLVHPAKAAADKSA